MPISKRGKRVEHLFSKTHRGLVGMRMVDMGRVKASDIYSLPPAPDGSLHSIQIVQIDVVNSASLTAIPIPSTQHV